MTKPWRFRPTRPDADWADNWLSNSIAWFSCTFMPHWCDADDRPNHWSLKVSEYLFADCPCCLALRCLALGAIGGGGLVGAAWVITGIID